MKDFLKLAKEKYLHGGKLNANRITLKKRIETF